MGWCSDSAPEHEGYLLAIRKDDWRWVELHSEDGNVDRVHYVQVGCECGWRSSRIAAPMGTTFMPSSVLASPAMEELGHRLWLEHLGGSMRPIKMPWSESGRCALPFEELGKIRDEMKEEP